MTNRPDKTQRKQLLREIRRQERAAFEASMPIAPATLVRLLDWLDGELDSCDGTTHASERFFDTCGVDAEPVMPWLAEHGGSCDCEVRDNLADLAEPFRAEPSRTLPTRRSKAKGAKRKQRSLETASGWDLERLPKPWRIANRYDDGEPLAIQLGKRGGCTLTIFEAPLPAGDKSNDAYWIDLWCQRTELPSKGHVTVTRSALDDSGQLQSVLVMTGSWTPVFCWVVPLHGEWHAEVRTDTRRKDGDLPQFAALIRELESGRHR